MGNINTISLHPGEGGHTWEFLGFGYHCNVIAAKKFGCKKIVLILPIAPFPGSERVNVGKFAY